MKKRKLKQWVKNTIIIIILYIILIALMIGCIKVNVKHEEAKENCFKNADTIIEKNVCIENY